MADRRWFLWLEAEVVAGGEVGDGNFGSKGGIPNMAGKKDKKKEEERKKKGR